MASYFAGDELRISIAFTNDVGTATDPTATTLTWQDAAGFTPKASATLAQLTKDSTGNYHYNIDTTNFVAGTWLVQIVATGAVAAVNVQQFVINARPL